MNKRAGLALVAGAFMIAIPLALLFRDLVRDAIVIPILYVVWRVDIFLRGFDTVLWWALFLVAAVYLFWQSLERVPLIRRRGRLDRPEPAGRVAFWVRQLERSDHSEYARWQLQHGLVQVALEMLDYDEEENKGRLGQTPDISGLGAPPEVRRFLDSGLNRPFESTAGRVSWWLQRSARPGAPLESDLDKVIAFLEEQAEV
jgi:hypothetical protein